MQINQRRVNKLYLNIGDESQTRIMLAKLEDAFNTASLPGLPPNRLVLIRHLELRSLPSTCSNIQISSHIDAAVRQIAATAVCLDTQPDTDADVVWFQDELQPCLVASLLLAQGKTLDKWYWQSLFPDMPKQPTANFLVDLLQDSTHVAETGPILICKHLLINGYLDVVLKLLEPHHVVQLLQLAGYMPGVLAQQHNKHKTVADISPQIAPVWVTTLSHWAQVWGEQDVRLFWLVLCAMQDANPAQGMKRDLSAVQSVIQKYVDHPVTARKDKSSTVTIQHKESNEDGSSVLKRKPDQLNEGSEKSDSELESESALLNAVDDSDDRLNSTQTKQNNDTNRDNDSRKYDYKDPQTSLESELVDAILIKENDNHLASHLDYSKLQQTAFAGLPLIVSLLEHLEIVNILNCHEHAIQNNLPAHVLWSVVERFKLDKTDPAIAFIPDIASQDPVTSFQFVAPASWMRMIQATPQTCLFVQQQNNTSRHVLTDQRNRIVLAIWYGQPPVSVADWLAETKLQKTNCHEFTPDLQLVINSFHLMMGLYLRKSCSMSLRRLVYRPGKVATTNTHVDSVYAADKVDIHLRQTGLDTNPGWVPWLGKIIQHHYEYEDEHYF